MESTKCQPLYGTPYGSIISANHPNCFGATIEAAYKFCMTRTAAVLGPSANVQNASQSQNNQDLISVITFSNTPSIIYEAKQNLSPQDVLTSLSQSRDYMGGTNFAAAIDCAREVITKHFQRDLQPVVIFLSDGECSLPDASIRTLIMENNARG
jgi:Mg-chelatase subunit ChlD